MYIQKAEITNIKSIEKFEIEFPNPAGWHVLIGDNGSGKSTIVRAIALMLLGNQAQIQGLRANWGEWLNKQEVDSSIFSYMTRNKSFDIYEIQFIDVHPNSEEKKYLRDSDYDFDFATRKLTFAKNDKNTDVQITTLYNNQVNRDDKIRKLNEYLDYQLNFSGFFSSAFGPYRRFEGGSSEWDEVYNNPSLANLAAHLSIFDESVALTEPIKWLKDLNYKTLEKNKESLYTLKNLKKLINSEDFLPHNSKLEKISSDGVFFKDGNGTEISVNQMSDGYRSILSLTFELIRQLVRVYGSEKVFKNIEKGEMFIDLPGVVLVDEIDAHLHPTWQTRIGQWFLKYFPQLQFIVTTHSPLVCRACEKGSIWKLAAPGSDEKSGEVTGIDRERLIYGNVLDAYGTGVFGENTSISEDSNEMLNRLSELNVKSMMGLINDKENIELQELRTKFPTESAIKK